MTVYRVNIQTLSPLHIGDGDELRQDFDFAVHGNNTYRLDEDAILLAKGDDIPEADRKDARRRLSQAKARLAVIGLPLPVAERVTLPTPPPNDAADFNGK